MAALDGLRAVAVLAVMAYHADEGWLPGGYLGVEVFFTISGYLITALLVTEYERTGSVDLRAFWIRRARRLLPALGVLLVGVALLSLVTARDALADLAGQAVAAAGYVMNWSLILTERSYFESFGRPPLLQHLWSLAIEEQFYLLFPPLFLVGRRLGGRRALLALVLVGAAASTWAMWRGWSPEVDPSRLYYGTDTRAAGILVGVALALVWRPWAGTAAAAVRGGPLADVLGVAGLGVLLSQLVVLGAYEPRLYRGGFLLVALATAAVVAAVATPGSFLAVPLSARPLRWLGERSYGLYLWHWPLFMVLRPGVDTVVGDPWLTVVRLGATVALAEISYTYVERPIREGRFLEQLRSLRRAAPETAALRRGAAVASLGVVAMVAVGNAQLPVDAAAAAEPEERPVPVAIAGRPVPLQVEVAEGAADPAPATRRYERVLVFGDSVVVGAREEVAAIGGAVGAEVVVDAAIGRQWHELVDDEAAPGPRDAVVVHLGSNGATNTGTIDEVLAHFADAGRVVLVTVRVPRPWETTVNRALSGATGRWPNTVLADWHGAADGTPAWFDGDGVHLSDAGARAFADVVVAGLTAP
jgi:peptidoglycan/LPS O-acetylase OafA/YrhL